MAVTPVTADPQTSYDGASRWHLSSSGMDCDLPGLLGDFTPVYDA
jgi:hypothetical protein